MPDELTSEELRFAEATAYHIQGKHRCDLNGRFEAPNMAGLNKRRILAQKCLVCNKSHMVEWHNRGGDKVWMIFMSEETFDPFPP